MTAVEFPADRKMARNVKKVKFVAVSEFSQVGDLLNVNVVISQYQPTCNKDMFVRDGFDHFTTLRRAAEVMIDSHPEN